VSILWRKHKRYFTQTQRSARRPVFSDAHAAESSASLLNPNRIFVIRFTMEYTVSIQHQIKGVIA